MSGNIFYDKSKKFEVGDRVVIKEVALNCVKDGSLGTVVDVSQSFIGSKVKIDNLDDILESVKDEIREDILVSGIFSFGNVDLTKIEEVK